MIVITIDQRKSRSRPDYVDPLVHQLNHSWEMLRAFERTAGDELQGVMSDGEAAVRLAMDVVATGLWSIGIGVGSVVHPLPQQTRAGQGPAFEAARDAVERAKSSPGWIAVSGVTGEAERIQAELQLAAELVRRRTRPATEAGMLIDAGLTQKEAAARLGVSQQAVSARLNAALWSPTANVIRHAGLALAEVSAHFDVMEP
ncbi:helix-turn-helix domain-containing protein [Paeniglutamicibacter cryotolerans]|uniref:HTH cro/C1-type domain-containing protein n=1 Tax=Paeniglutamicibacter cryotolerans TaxID=670079 RepID=A0A839QTA7_9MICC|nr:helix-turn-helix domain-containing protein [Paeniglutamicibacter cryotolerans]MBB2997206.1 hypothetical protein [Paeniglutamicibacter cryotolerans]